ncbi:MAG: hypothetical protein ABI591_02455 [Kofleriaceae bacterium]
MTEPAGPEAVTREHLLDVLGELVARNGAAPLLLPPVAPGEHAFPEPWAATRSGITLLLRRLAWHANLDREVEVEDRRDGASLTERKPATRVELLEVRRKVAAFALGFIGEDDIVGTLAHEVGVAFGVLHPPTGAAPYRTAEADVLAVEPDDLERGSIATIYLGLGVLAANAARQQHSVLEGQGFNPMLVAKVGVQIESGHAPVASLVYLLAVQAAVRGDKQPPPGLVPAQRREVASWLETLDGATLRARLGIAADAAIGVRPPAIAFADAKLEPDATAATNAFRWTTTRGGVGFIAGTVLGLGMSLVVSRGMMPWLALGGGGSGHVIGRRLRVPRCSACATILVENATTCRKCGAVMRGDIAHLSERLDAEDKLHEHDDDAT